MVPEVPRSPRTFTCCYCRCSHVQTIFTDIQNYNLQSMQLSAANTRQTAEIPGYQTNVDSTSSGLPERSRPRQETTALLTLTARMVLNCFVNIITYYCHAFQAFHQSFTQSQTCILMFQIWKAGDCFQKRKGPEGSWLVSRRQQNPGGWRGGVVARLAKKEPCGRLSREWCWGRGCTPRPGITEGERFLNPSPCACVLCPLVRGGNCRNRSQETELWFTNWRAEQNLFT